MQYQAPMRIAALLESIHRHEYVLPAIQREFVWKPHQIAHLFDSLMRGYPIGTFLFWKVRPEAVSNYAFYDFVTNYDERYPHNPPASPPPHQTLTAVLDGQQRMTAFNIALRGTHATKIPRKRWDDPAAFPQKRLCIDLLHRNLEPDPEEGVYKFEFLTNPEIDARNAEGDVHWFPVPKALQLDVGPQIHSYLMNFGLAADANAFETLFRLVKLVTDDEVVTYYEETSDDLDKVLDIFIRVNKGGTKLSYSDLLLSVATATWAGDARQQIYSLVDDMNSIGKRFAFDKDRVLKASLVMSDQQDIKFKVANFKIENVAKIEQRWDGIEEALLLATKLFAAFGLSSETVSAQNVIIPVAYYLQQRGFDDRYLTSGRYAEDRTRIRSWVIRSMLRAGVWTGAVDAVLIATRDLVRKHGSSGFPLDEIETWMTTQQKSLTFSDGEVDALLSTEYRQRNAYLLLALLYPATTGAQHVDHVFPKSRLTKRRLAQEGLGTAQIPEYISRVNQLPNLQLLDRVPNEEKLIMWPWEWAARHVPEHDRPRYRAYHDLDPLPSDISGFVPWFEGREKRMKERLLKLLA